VFNYYVEVLRKYAVFEGRAGRPEYWWFFLANIIVYGVLAILASAAGTFFSVLLVLYALGVFLPSLGVTIRRLHDTDRSGWWILVGIVPLVGAIVLIVFYASEGTRGPNKYGAAPAGAAWAGTAGGETSS
jgi:uncharacterized membrane protein YhaH (DUF805 family)